MERLTRKFPLDIFNRCQLCGFEDDDICEFTMWQECDEQDQPEPYNVLVACRKCYRVIDQHERGYREVPWGQGDPGYLMLLCSDCTLRDGSRCTHPNLKANGGAGLLLHKNQRPGVTVCFHDDSKEGGLRCSHEGFPAPFVRCEGFQKRDHEI